MTAKNKTVPDLLAAGFGLTSGVLILLVLTGCGLSGDSGSGDKPYFAARRGPLTISVTESGTIENKERIVIKNKVKGKSTIVWVLDEGKAVQKGDLLMELDSSTLEDKRLDVEMRVKNAEANLVVATEALGIEENQTQSDNEKAELVYRFAGLDLKKYIEGAYPQELQSAEADITIVQEELQRAEDQQAWSIKLFESGYVTRSELQADELVVKRNQIRLELAKGKMELLKTFTHPQQVEKLESDLKQAKMAYERTLRRSKAKILQAEASLRARQAENDQAIRHFADINEEIVNCRILAPSEGMVVYAAGAGNRWGRNQAPLEIGLEINEGQELMYLPANRQMQAKISIPETGRTKVGEGMKALIHVDALRGRVFKGRVAKLAILPDASKSWLNPDLKLYNCDILIDDVIDEINPGMGCRVEIVVQEIDDAVYVPVQCVTRLAGYPAVYVKNGRKDEPRKVEIGADNNQMIHVISGLEAGEQVMLAPPVESVRGVKSARKSGAGVEGKDADAVVEDGGKKRVRKNEQ